MKFKLVFRKNEFYIVSLYVSITSLQSERLAIEAIGDGCELLTWLQEERR